MDSILIEDSELIQQLHEISHQEARPIETILRDLVALYAINQTEKTTDPLLQLALSAEELGLVADADDIAENFNDYLRQTRQRKMQE